MCRFTFYLGNPLRVSALITEPNHSLIKQSFNAKEREEPLNGDGFGLAWYSEDLADEPALFKSITPAWSNRNLFELAQVIETGCLLAHVRAATQGFGVTENNCHPFKYGRFAFMHNGDIGGFSRLRKIIVETLSDKAFQQIYGSTDSEHFFGLFLDEVWKMEDPYHIQSMKKAVMNTIQKVTALVKLHCPGEHCYLNMVVTNGDEAIVTRFSSNTNYADSLYICHDKQYICQDGYCRLLDADEKSNAVLVSSEPLSIDDIWVKVELNTLLVIDRKGIQEKFLIVT